MSVQIALGEATNDIIKADGGGIVRVDKGRYAVQLVKNKLLTLLGEWRLDPSKGWISFDDFTRNPDLFDLEVRAKQVILSVTGVQKIDTMELVLKKRALNLSFTATTIYGGIDLTVPWSM